jgi:TM2 domain-containing membrane protein YozV
MRGKICPKCQTPTQLDSRFCNKCGHAFRTQFVDQTQLQQQPQPYTSGDSRPGRPAVNAIIASFAFVGMGQMVNGQAGKGVMSFFATLYFLWAFWPIGVFFWILAFVDTILIAQRIERGETVHAWQFF